MLQTCQHLWKKELDTWKTEHWIFGEPAGAGLKGVKLIGHWNRNSGFPCRRNIVKRSMILFCNGRNPHCPYAGVTMIFCVGILINPNTKMESVLSTAHVALIFSKDWEGDVEWQSCIFPPWCDHGRFGKECAASFFISARRYLVVWVADLLS